MNLKVLKLRSGEEIACEVLEENSENLVISKPMIFKTESMTDLSGRTVTVTSLQDWLGNTTNKSITLPTNHIIFTSEPNESTSKMYILEIEKEKIRDELNSKINKHSNDIDMFGMFLDTLMNNGFVEEEEINQKPKRRKAKRQPKKEYLPPDMEDESELDRHMIMMQLYIPAEAIMNLITSGILKPETLLEMIKEVKKRNRFTGDEKNRKDFGTKLSDWNPDPNSDDYK